MKITAYLFTAFLKCPTKCYLQSLGEAGPGNEYADWVMAQTKSYHAAGVERLRRNSPQDECLVSPSLDDLKQTKWWLAVDVLGATETLKTLSGEKDIEAFAQKSGKRKRPGLVDSF